ncbi:MAG TPA: hypothetical protein PLQ56_00310 [Aggregatilineales bacterium]|nr:hypothetical protein [Anaerolineae bacterium]HUN05001.1 hypothetical protein [Aggregatilineales bacterium]
MFIIRRLQRIGKDILAGRNIDAYVVGAIAIVLAILGVLDDIIPLNVKLSAILAALALLVLNTTRPETRSADLDEVLQDRRGFGRFQDLIKGRRALWIYGPSAVNILRDRPLIREDILDRGGEVRVLVQDPNAAAGLDQLHHILDQTDDLENSLRMSIDNLGRMKDWGGKFEYRLLAYSPGFSIVVVDPEGREGKVIVEFFGYQNDLITERMHIEISRQESQHWFEYWVKQYEKMWAAGKKADQQG